MSGVVARVTIDTMLYRLRHSQDNSDEPLPGTVLPDIFDDSIPPRSHTRSSSATVEQLRAIAVPVQLQQASVSPKLPDDKDGLAEGMMKVSARHIEPGIALLVERL